MVRLPVVRLPVVRLLAVHLLAGLPVACLLAERRWVRCRVVGCRPVVRRPVWAVRRPVWAVCLLAWAVRFLVGRPLVRLRVRWVRRLVAGCSRWVIRILHGLPPIFRAAQMGHLLAVGRMHGCSRLLCKLPWRSVQVWEARFLP